MVVSFIFVSQQGFIHELIGSVVRLATASRFSHVAIGFEDCIIEAKMPRVTVSPIDKFSGETERTVISFVVSEDAYGEARRVAKEHIGKLYGLDDCVIGGLHDLFDIHLGDLDISATIDCSGLATVVARVLFPDLLCDTEISEVTPERLYSALKEAPWIKS